MGTRVPEAVLEGVRRALGSRGREPPAIEAIEPVGGGCVNPSVRLDVTGGVSFFLKWNDDPPGLFSVEARGLKALARNGPLRVPDVAAVGGGGSGAAGWLLLEFVPEGRPGPAYGRALGRGLAELHRPAGDDWGWQEDNFIGPLPQSNTARSRWAEFWVEERLRPQLRRARDAGAFAADRDAWDELFRRMEGLVAPAEEEGPSLLHGDLWSGNVYPGPDGEPVLVDPAVYRGHREVDLAMTELFGGFPSDFHAAYREARPLASGYRETRRAVYQLYPLLVHVNLFGGGYVDRTRRALRRALEGGGSPAGRA